MSPFTAFLITASVLAITPGPGIAYVTVRTCALRLSGRHRDGRVEREDCAVLSGFSPQFGSASEPFVPQLVMLGSICVALSSAVDVVAVFAAVRLLVLNAARANRACLMTRISGVTMLGLTLVKRSR